MGATATGSEIEHVTVYSRGARVRRVTAAGIAGAAGEVRITGLPLAVVDDTVRAEVVGAGVVTGLRVELDAAGATERAGDELDREVRAAKARVTAADAELARLTAALGGLAALAPIARRARPDGAVVPAWSKSFDARLAVLELRVAREAELRAALDAGSREKRDATEALAAAQDRAGRASTGRGLQIHELCKTVVATIEGAADAPRIAVEYVVAAARWAPTYCARLAGGKAELELRAVVAQNTGEDWRAARLTLSTAEPMRFAELPELPMARIGRRQPQVAKKGFRPPPTGVEVLYQDFDRAFPGRIQRAPDAKAFTERTPRDEDTQDRAVPYAEASRLMPPPPVAEFDTDEAAVYNAQRLSDDWGDKDSQATPVPRSARRPAPPPPASEVAAITLRPQARGRTLAGVGAVVAAPIGAVAALGGMLMKRSAGGDAPEDFKTRMGVALDASVELDLLGDDAAALLAYGELRMMAAVHARRGKLVRVGVVAQYVEALAARGIALAPDADVAGAVAWRVAQVEAMILPPGATEDWDHYYDHAFPGDAPVDIASDGTWHAIAVSARSAPVEVRHVVVPREGTEVYRIAELTNPLGAPLLPGPIDVFDDGVYLLTSSVDGVPAGAPVELGLGVDPKVKASRNTDYREESSGMLRGSLKLDHAVTVEIANHSPRTIDVEVRERLPVVPDGNDDIELTVIRTEPQWERWDPGPDGPRATRLKGGHRWRLAVPAGETRTLSAAYEIRIAAKHELVGGNRRES